MEQHDRMLTIVVPVFNEIGALERLYGALTSILSTLGRPCEIIFVDDGSTYGIDAELDYLAARDPQVHVLHIPRNYGKSAALDAAFRRARGNIVITLDADMQNDPAEIPRFIEKIGQGADLVSGWRRQRRGSIYKTISSGAFNAVMRRVSNAGIHDFNCGFKAYRAECLAGLHLYGGLHRFIPALLHWNGFIVDEVEITDHRRSSGRSKFGTWRIFTSALDLLTILLIGKFRSRPLHFFGSIALTVGLAAIVALGYCFALLVFGIEPMRPRSMFYAAVVLIVLSVVLLGMGLLGELIKSLLLSGAPDYLIRNTKQADESELSGQADVKRQWSR